MRSLTRRYGKLYAGVVYDAMAFDLKLKRPFVVSRHVKPLWRMRRPLVGPAFTCLGRRVPPGGSLCDTVRLEMLSDMHRGCVQVIDTGHDTTCAHFGDVSAQLARQHGAAGCVIDGYTRDAQRIERQRFPLFVRGTQPTDAYGRWQITRWGVEVTLQGPEGDVRVRPGDLVFGDQDGVLVVPAEHAETVCRCAEVRRGREDMVRRQVRPGNELALYDRVGRW